MRQKHSYYEYEVYQNVDCTEHWLYCIYCTYYKNEVIRESDEWFKSEQEAKDAAIDHIGSLEDGER